MEAVTTAVGGAVLDSFHEQSGQIGDVPSVSLPKSQVAAIGKEALVMMQQEKEQRIFGAVGAGALDSFHKQSGQIGDVPSVSLPKSQVAAIGKEAFEMMQQEKDVLDTLHPQLASNTKEATPRSKQVQGYKEHCRFKKMYYSFLKDSGAQFIL